MNTTKNKFAFADKSLLVRVLLIILITLPSIAFFGVILFVSAWTINWFKAWAFLIVFGLVTFITSLIAVIKDPDLVDYRMAKKPGVQKWDLIIVKILGLNTFILLIVAGLDERFQLLSDVPNIISFIALPFTSIYVIIQLWAGTVNKHFEGGVRIQEDRQHTVIQTGPYKIVRHLFYSTFIFFWLAAPLALGSFLALFPGLLGVFLLIYRTAKEDKFLQENLKGYKEYSEKVKYRLIPGIW